MTLTLEPQEGVQYVTVRADDAPVAPAFKQRETAAEHAARMLTDYNEARAIHGLPPVERRRYRGKA